MDYLTKQYDFDAFLDRIMNLQWHEILQAAEQECSAAESVSYGRKGAVAARAAGSTRYAEQLKELLFWLRYGQKPSGIGDAAWRRFRLIAVHLVEIGNLKPEVLQAWPES